MKQVLIVGDDASIRLLVRSTLAATGCTLLEAGDGAEAVRLVEQEHPDLVLLDVMMPELTGMQVCWRIKTDPRFRDVWVVMLTAVTHPTDQEAAKALGADDYLEKPFGPSQLLPVVGRLLASDATPRAPTTSPLDPDWPL